MNDLDFADDDQPNQAIIDSSEDDNEDGNEL
jgi:hypothetical protein